MTPKEKKKITSAIVKTLKEKNIYNKDTDDILIDSIVFNLELIRGAKDDIEARGQMVNLRKSSEDPFWQINFSISIFHNAVKSINTLLKQLGLEKLKVESDSKEDALSYLNEIIKR
jgi:hypothetical protein